MGKVFFRHKIEVFSTTYELHFVCKHFEVIIEIKAANKTVSSSHVNPTRHRWDAHFSRLFVWMIGNLWNNNPAYPCLRFVPDCYSVRFGSGVLWWACCLSVCLSVRISQVPHVRTSRCSVHVTCGRGSVVFWRRCDTLYVIHIRSPHSICSVQAPPSAPP